MKPHRKPGEPPYEPQQNARDGAHPVVWCIGGTDPSGASGLAADLHTVNTLGGHPCPVVTGVTAQSATTFAGRVPTAPKTLMDQCTALAEDLTPSAIKIGMLDGHESIGVLGNLLDSTPAPKVYDPVMKSTSGGSLLEPRQLEAVRSAVIPRVDLVTPNLPESETLAGVNIETPEDVQQAGNRLLNLGANAVLITGGHSDSQGEVSQDFYCDHDTAFWLTGRRFPGRPRGTGCAYSSAWAAFRGFGYDGWDAAVGAKAYVTQAIAEAKPFAEADVEKLGHYPWPPSGQMTPWITKTAEAGRDPQPFPGLGSEPIGFYPIVDRASWLSRLGCENFSTIQLRIKDLGPQEVETEVRSAVETAQKTGCRLFVNDHWKTAIACNAYGVHLGQEDLPDVDLEAIRKAGLRLGISTHSLFEAARAHGLRPSYIALGPVKPTTCKSMRFGPQGFARLREWRSLFPEPLVAIGGLTPEDIPELKAAGVDGCAVLSDVTEAKDPAARAAQWASQWKVPRT